MPHDWTPLLGLALVSQLIGQGLMIYALGRFSPLVVGIALLIQPVVAAAIGLLVYGERLGLPDLIGAVLVAVALVLVRDGPKEPDQLAIGNMTLPADPTLDEIRAALAPAIAANAGFDGWSDAALTLAARAEGVDIDVARLAFPGGAIDMIDAWFADIDSAMTTALPAERLATMKIREKITALVEARL
eukprot:gene43258-58597_t